MNEKLPHRELTSLIRLQGVSLRHLGSGEYGLEKALAKKVVCGLCDNEVAPLGIEVWVRQEDDYWLDEELDWHAPGNSRLGDCRRAALSHIDRTDIPDSALLTVQFEGSPYTTE